MYVMTADTARYPAPPGINSTSPPVDWTGPDWEDMREDTKSREETDINTNSRPSPLISSGLTERPDWRVVAISAGGPVLV